ncbi:MAG: hypothetical protein U0103_04865 [Candidatus Obscuribacterales bacterium]
MAPEKPITDVPPIVPADVHDASAGNAGGEHTADQYDALRAATWGPSAAIGNQPWMPALARSPEPSSGSLDMVSGTVTAADITQPQDQVVRQDDVPDAPDTPEAKAQRAQDFADTLKKLNVDQSQVQEVDENGKPLKPRDSQDVKDIVLREGHKEGDPKPNFIIDKDGNIHEVIDPNNARSEGDGAIIIEIDPNSEGKAATQAQRTAAQAMIAAIKANWHGSNIAPDIPDDLITAANAADPPPVYRSRPSGGGSGSVIGGAGGGGGGGRGFSGGGMAGAGGPERHMPRPSVGSDGHIQPRLDQNSPLFKALDTKNSLQDRIIAATAGLESGGKFDVINHNDAGHGWSVGIRQWNQQAGELPSLIQAMYDRDPAKFNQDFGQFAGQLIKNGKVDENFVRHTNFNALGPGFESGMKQALSDFQDVQIALARQWAQSGIELAQKYGMKSELGYAEVADAVNQYGYGGAESRLRRIGTGGDEASRIQAFDNALGSQRGSRLAQLSTKFSADRTANA